MISFNKINSDYINAQTPKDKILSIGGSPRAKGNSDILLQTISQGIKNAKVATEVVQLRNFQFQSCIACEKCRTTKICTGLNDGLSLLYPKIIESTGLILVSPTHNYNITALMKSFIDRLYCFYSFDNNNRPGKWSSQLAGQGRKALIVAVCEQKTKKDMGFTLDAMRLPLEALGYEVVEELAIFGVFARGKVKEKTDILSKAYMLGSNFAKTIS